MSGLDKIVSRLESECESSCEKIKREAEKSFEEEIARGKELGEKKAAEIIREAEKEAQSIINKAHSQAELNERTAILSAKNSLINEIVEGARKKLLSLGVNEYFELLTRLVNRNKREQRGVLFLSEKDLNRMPESFPEKLGPNIEINKTPENIADGFILKYGDIEINCTMNAMFSAYSDELKSIAGEILFN